MKSSFSETVPTRYLHRLRCTRDEMIRNLFEIPTERQRREHAERIARAQRNFLRWVKTGKYISESDISESVVILRVRIANAHRDDGRRFIKMGSPRLIRTPLTRRFLYLAFQNSALSR